MEHLETGNGDEAVERDARAAHDALRNGVNEHDERSEEGKHHAAECRGEDGNDGSVAGDGDAADGLAVGGVCTAAEERAHNGAEAVADEGLIEARVCDEVAVDNRAEVLVVSDVLCELDDADRNVDHGDVADGSRIKRILAVRLDCFEEEELRIIDDAGDAECAECIDERLEGKELEALCARCHADDCKDECKRIARADADDKRNELDGFGALNGRNDNHEEGEDAADDGSPVVGLAVYDSCSAVAHDPACCRAGEGQTDERDDRSDDDGRHQLIDPTGADDLDDKTDDDVNKTCERNADEHAPVAVILTDCSRIRAEEGERGAEEYRASALGAEQVYDGADARAEQCGCGVCLQAVAGDKQRYEQRSRHDGDHLLECEDQCFAELRLIFDAVNQLHEIISFLPNRGFISYPKTRSFLPYAFPSIKKSSACKMGGA